MNLSCKAFYRSYSFVLQLSYEFFFWHIRNTKPLVSDDASTSIRCLVYRGYTDSFCQNSTVTSWSWSSQDFSNVLITFYSSVPPILVGCRIRFQPNRMYHTKLEGKTRTMAARSCIHTDSFSSALYCYLLTEPPQGRVNLRDTLHSQPFGTSRGTLMIAWSRLLWGDILLKGPIENIFQMLQPPYDSASFQNWRKQVTENSNSIYACLLHVREGILFSTDDRITQGVYNSISPTQNWMVPPKWQKE